MEENETLRQPVKKNCLTPARFAVFLTLAVGVFFPSIIFGVESFFFRDFGIYGYPMAHYHRESFWRGEIPLWNPYSATGMPFLAQWSTMALYPLSLVYLLLPLPWSLNVLGLIHLVLAGMGMYFLARKWTDGNDLAAALAGIIFAFNGFSLNCLIEPNTIAVLCWMPWTVLAVQEAVRQGGRYILLAVLPGSFALLTGAPEATGLTWIFCGILLVGEIWTNRHRPREAARKIFRFGLIFILILLVCSAQLLPFIDFLRHSNRDHNTEFNTWPMPIWGWFNLFAPLYGCYRSSQGVFFQPFQDWTSSYYVGAFCMALAVGRFYYRRDFRTWILAGVILISLVLALGYSGILYKVLSDWLPFFKIMRFPIKFVVLAIFCFPLLAALGLDALFAVAAKGELRKFQLVSALVILVVMVAAALTGGRLYPRFHADMVWNTWIRAGFAFALIIALRFLFPSPRAKHAALWQIGFLALCAADLLLHVPRQNPTVPASVCRPGLIEAPLTTLSSLKNGRAMMLKPMHDMFYFSIRTNASTDYLGRRLGLYGDLNLLDNVPIADGFYPMYLPAQRKCWEQVFFSPPPQFPARLADAMGIHWVSSTNTLFKWDERPSFMPLVTGGQKPVFLDLKLALGADLPDDPRRCVFLDPSDRSQIPDITNSPVAIENLSVRAHDISFDTQTEQEAMVVISQSFYHPWHAFVENKETSIYRANGAFQAIAVPPGKHRIRFEYWDTMFFAGTAISIVTLQRHFPFTLPQKPA